MWQINFCGFFGCRYKKRLLEFGDYKSRYNDLHARYLSLQSYIDFERKRQTQLNLENEKLLVKIHDFRRQELQTVELYESLIANLKKRHSDFES